MTQAQQWLDNKYNNKQSEEDIKLLTSEELSGEIKIEGYTKTKTINLVRLENNSLSEGKITKVIIKDCPSLETVILGKNEITSITFEGNYSNLTRLEVQDNQLEEIDFSGLTNLEFLNFARNPINSQKIEEGLRNLTKLKFVNLLGTPGVNLKNLGGDRTDWINPNDIKNVLGINPNNPLPDDWKNKLDNKEKYKGFIDPEDASALEKAVSGQGKTMVSQADLSNLKNNQCKHKQEDLKPTDYDTIKSELNKIKNLLGIPSTSPLSGNWINQVAKKSDLDAARNDLNKWTGKFLGKSPEQVEAELKKSTGTGVDPSVLQKLTTKVQSQQELISKMEKRLKQTGSITTELKNQIEVVSKQ